MTRTRVPATAALEIHVMNGLSVSAAEITGSEPSRKNHAMMSGRYGGESGCRSIGRTSPTGRLMKAIKRLLGLTTVMTLGALSLISCATSRDRNAEQFVGLWRLVSWENRHTDGTTTQDPRSVSYLIYTDTGQMAYLSMDPNRPKWVDWRSPTGPEAIAAIMGVGAYSATVEVHADEGYILHHVELEKVPNNVGITRKRLFTFEGPDRLVLRLDPEELAPSILETALTWERVSR